MSRFSQNQYSSVVNTPIGKISLTVKNDQLITLDFLYDDQSIQPVIHPATEHLVEDLKGYLNDPHYQFKYAVQLYGSHFQNKIWQTLLEIPIGKTRTYGQVAKEHSSSPRAVGQACRSNPIPIFVPCHRIVAANGLGGFSGKRQGKWLKLKEWLLKHEGLS